METPLISLIRSAVRSEHTVLQENKSWEKLLEQARFHHVLPILCYALNDLPDVPDDVQKALCSAQRESIFCSIQRSHSAQMIRAALTEAEIPHILLRGALLQKDYPCPDMRTMSDLDYLVRSEDYPKIKAAMERLGGTHLHTDGGHYSFRLPPQVAVEFHPNLIYVASPVGTAINPGWQYVDPNSPPYAQELTEEGFYLNMICHMAYHFAGGGVGIRSVLDVWVYRHRHIPQPDPVFVRRELERAGLWKFSQLIEALAECWFGDGEMTTELQELSDCILKSGTYGTHKQAVLYAACLSGEESRWSALKSKAFYPVEELEHRFPWSKGRTWLLPAAWGLRAFRAITRHRRQIRLWSKETSQISKDDIVKQREQLQRFGLMKKEETKQIRRSF